jgi:hypothetical protein
LGLNAFNIFVVEEKMSRMSQPMGKSRILCISSIMYFLLSNRNVKKEVREYERGGGCIGKGRFGTEE